MNKKKKEKIQIKTSWKNNSRTEKQLLTEVSKKIAKGEEFTVAVGDLDTIFAEADIPTYNPSGECIECLGEGCPGCNGTGIESKR